MGKPILWCLTAAALFGASTPASKLLLNESVGPLMLAGLLYLGAGLATLPSARSGGSPVRRRSPSNLRRLLGAVLFGGVIGPIALMLGLSAAPSASVSLWLNLETTATAVLAWAFFRENLGWRAWLANALVVVAGVLLASPEGFSLAPSALLVVLACVCWGLDNNLTAIIDGYTPTQVTAAKGLGAGTVSIGLGLLIGEPLPGLGAAAASMAIGALAYGASIILYIQGAHQLGATRSQMLFSTAPFLGVLFAWLALGESIVLVQLGAAGIMLGALALLLTDRHGHSHTHPALVHAHGHTHNDGHHGHTHEGLPDDIWHTHEHAHDMLSHTHPHLPDIHHRHAHAQEHRH
jgi:drug/metabolite transporter (DMT)-like permease